MMNKSNRAVVIWLSLVCLMIFSMVVVGGITRLTHSGLSMVEWKPLMGAIPPLNQEQWQDTFSKYQATPEYLKLNLGMSLEGFKSIFFWEYFHRLLARVTVLSLVIPFFFFLLCGKLDPLLARRLWIGFFIAGLEGPMGWLMVKSGMVDNPHVSHYRLAAHLALALILLSYLFWIILGLRNKKNTAISALRKASLLILIGVSLEIIYGAFTAGLKAGLMYNTFPKMNGEWIPPNFFYLTPLWRNFLENHGSVQFLHRAIALCLLLAVAGFRFYASRFSLNREQKTGVNLVLIILCIQAGLGIGTLLFVVPVLLAVLHQAVACVLLLTALFVFHSFSSQKAC